MRRGCFLVLCLTCLVWAGCVSAPAGRRVGIVATNQARADYEDDVTGRRFAAKSDRVDVDVLRFASMTATIGSEALTTTAGPGVARSSAYAEEVLSSHPPEAATGLQVALVGRHVQTPTPLIASQRSDTLSADLAMARMTGESALGQVLGWRELLMAEVRTAGVALTSPRPYGQMVQWPYGVHDVTEDVPLASILLREDFGVAKAPIVILNYLTRFEQRPRLVLTKTADRDRAFAGETVTYTVTVFNDSPVEAANIVLADLVDEQVDYRPDSAACSRSFTFKTEITAEKKPVLLWRLKDPLGPHESAVITYQLLVRKAWFK